MAIENRIFLKQIFKRFKKPKKSQQQNTSHIIEQYGDPDVIKESKYVSNYFKSDNYVGNVNFYFILITFKDNNQNQSKLIAQDDRKFRQFPTAAS